MPPDFTGELRTIFTAAAFAPIADRAFLRINGPDATRWLNGMVTNSVQALAPGEGNYNFLLNAQGRIQGDGLLFREPGALDHSSYLFATSAAQVDTIHRHLDHFIIMDDVELAPAFSEESGLLLLGPDTPAQLTAMDLPMLDPLRLARADTEHGPVLLLTLPAPTVPAVELHASPETMAALCNQLEERKIPRILQDTLEQLRMLDAAPKFGIDIRDRELPQETNQPHALHFAKGCYLGQEIVERIRSRGQVHRVFTPLRLDGSRPETLPAALESNGKPVGEITSAAELDTVNGPVQIALGYVRREALETHQPLAYPHGTARPRQPGTI